MSHGNRWALKEWAAVCAALASGRQTVLLRKGGIAEGSEGFRVEHPEFWLLPTRFHQSANELRPDHAHLLGSPGAAPPPAGELEIGLYACCDRVEFVEDESNLSAVIPRQVLSAETVRERFHYRRPGLFVLTLRVFRLLTPNRIVDDPVYAGCHSWVELTTSLATDSLVPVLADEQFSAVAGADPSTTGAAT